MTWFKVDDTFHSHPKALAAEPAALGLWVLAGSWCSANLTDGFVPDYALPRILPDSAPLAEKLVACRLWKRTRGGYRFHDFADYNPTAEVVQDERKAARERMRKVRASRKGAGKTAGQDDNCSPEQQANVQANNQRTFGRSSPTPTRPDPKGRGGTGRSLQGTSVTRADSEPPQKCPEHINDPDPPPCGGCADARRAHAAWEHQLAAEASQQQAERARQAAAANRAAIDACPTCDHRGYVDGLLCHHDPDAADRARSGAAAARAALRIVTDRTA